jgi:hypothetical protein
LGKIEEVLKEIETFFRIFLPYSDYEFIVTSSSENIENLFDDFGTFYDNLVDAVDEINAVFSTEVCI